MGELIKVSLLSALQRPFCWSVLCRWQRLLKSQSRTFHPQHLKALLMPLFGVFEGRLGDSVFFCIPGVAYRSDSVFDSGLLYLNSSLLLVVGCLSL